MVMRVRKKTKNYTVRSGLPLYAHTFFQLCKLMINLE